MSLLDRLRRVDAFRQLNNDAYKPPAFVAVRLLGGLGNQMFQYATGRALALRLGVELVVDVNAFARDQLRKYELSKFPISGRVASVEELMGSAPRTSSDMLMRRMARILGHRRSRAVIFKEASFNYDPHILELSAPVYLDGYWQSERYFVDVAEVLRRDFALETPIGDPNEHTASLIQSAGNRAVSLHVRRGDYVSNAQTAKYHGVCSLNYYEAAIEYISSHVSNPIFFVFSDDLEWVRANLRADYQMVFVDANDASRGAWDMELMRRCRHHVIANSSFSWWGAWLNPSLDKIVVAPRRWFSGATHDTRDLIPASWVRL